MGFEEFGYHFQKMGSAIREGGSRWPRASGPSRRFSNCKSIFGTQQSRTNAPVCPRADGVPITE
jgi:hypothetical protein